eukprot:3332892-Heterocapsa_arctica.AAC.1
MPSTAAKDAAGIGVGDLRARPVRPGALGLRWARRGRRDKRAGLRPRLPRRGAWVVVRNGPPSKGRRLGHHGGLG